MTAPAPPRRRLLDPTERFSEILFGLIMVMTFTGTLSVAQAGRDDVREMLVGALGCNLAWGLADAVMYVITSVSMRARGNVLLRKLKGTADPHAAAGLIRETLPDRVAEIMAPGELDAMRRRLIALPDPPKGLSIGREDFLAAAAVCLLVFLSTFPPTLPFLFIQDATIALRISNAIALAMLFVLGYALGRYTGGRPWRLGFGMLALGAVLVAIVIALGG